MRWLFLVSVVDMPSTPCVHVSGVLSVRALGEKSKSEPLSGNSPLIPSYDLTAMQAESSEVWFPEELKKREDFKTSIGRCYIEGALQGAFPEAGHIIPVSVNRKSKKVWIVNNPTISQLIH